MNEAAGTVVRGQLLGVLVDERDRTSLGTTRRTCDCLSLRLLRSHSERRNDRRPTIVVETGEGRIDSRHRPGGVERPGQDLVEIDRSGELTEHPVSPPLLLGVLERLRQLADHHLHAGVQIGHEVGEALVALRSLAGASDEPEDDQKQGDNCRSGGDGYDYRRRHSDHPNLIPPPSFLHPRGSRSYSGPISL